MVERHRGLGLAARLLVAAMLLSAVLINGCGSGSAGTVTGRVVDDLGNLLGGVTVSVGTASAQTSGNGTYTVVGAPLGSQALTAVLAHYAFTPQAVNIVSNQTLTVNLTGTFAEEAPVVTVTASPSQIAFEGGSSTLTMTATSPNSQPLTVALTAAGGVNVPLTSLGNGNYSAVVTLPANNTNANVVNTYVASANDLRITTDASATVTVAGLSSPSGVGNGTTPGGGGPPTPNIRHHR